jgi:glycine/D-amino acid oxidase-like deaminating enzyme
MDTTDITVIGLGAHGSSTLYFLARKYPELSLRGIEKHTAGNQYGSSGGFSRIIRKAYFESPAYVSLLERSYELYKDIEFDAKTQQLSYSTHPQNHLFTQGYDLLHITGGLDIGPIDSTIVKGAEMACVENNLPYEILTKSQVAERWPIELPGKEGEYYAVYQKDGGFLEPEKTNFTMVELAQKSKNTTISYGKTVLDVEMDISTGFFSIFMLDTEELRLSGDHNVFKYQTCQAALKSLKKSENVTVLISKRIVLGTGPWIQDTMTWTIFSEQERNGETKQGKMFKKLDKFFNQNQTQVQRQVVNWHAITPPELNPTRFDSPNFPIFLIHHQEKSEQNEQNEQNENDIVQSAQNGQNCPSTSPSFSNPNDKGLSSKSKNNTNIDPQTGQLIVDPSNTNSINDKNNTDHFYYGFPSMRPGDNSMKIGRYHHLHEDNVHQDDLNRQSSWLDILATAHCVKNFFPGVNLPKWYQKASDYVNNEIKNVESITNVGNFLTNAKRNLVPNDTTDDINAPFPLSDSNVTISKVCTFTNTYDGHFLIQPINLLPGGVETASNQDTTLSIPNILCLSCCSGHGYKFNAVLGEICADLVATGKADFDIEWLGIDRVVLE